MILLGQLNQMNRVLLPVGIKLDHIGDWRDITSTLPGGAPFTLALEDGFGALQFSSGLYRSGPLPNATAGDLLRMLSDFFFRRNLGQAVDLYIGEGAISIVAGTSHKNGLIRVWYISDSRSIVLATYTGDVDHPEELEECERMIRSIEIVG